MRFRAVVVAITISALSVQYASADTLNRKIFDAPMSEDAPEGYYFDVANNTWWLYDGETLTEQPEDFMPPLAEQEKFDVSVRDTATSIGYELHIKGKYIGEHTIYYTIYYKFEKISEPYCLGEDGPPPCVHYNHVNTSAWPPVLGKILSGVDRTDGGTDLKPNNGWASADGWMDDSARTQGAADYSDGPVTW